MNRKNNPIQTNDMSLYCTFCGSVFDSELRLRIHMERFCVHTAAPGSTTDRAAAMPTTTMPIPNTISNITNRGGNIHNIPPPPPHISSTTRISGHNSTLPKTVTRSLISNNTHNNTISERTLSDPYRQYMTSNIPLTNTYIPSTIHSQQHLPPHLSQHPQQQQQQHIDVIPSLYFSGALQPGFLTGGCGWWIVQDKKVIAHGGIHVHQLFPSMLGLEYEGLLNGLQVAMRKWVKRLIIKSESDFILAYLSTTIQSRQPPIPYLHSVFREHETIQVAIDVTLKVCICVMHIYVCI